MKMKIEDKPKNFLNKGQNNNILTIKLVFFQSYFYDFLLS